MLGNVLKRVLQVLVISLMLAAIGYFADSPAYRVLDDIETEIKLVVRHSGKLIGECTAYSPEEIAEQAANMRRALSCPREKSPLLVELLIGDEVIYENTVHPSGIHSDGVIALYKNFHVPKGTASIELRVKDRASAEEYSHRMREDLQLTSASILVVEFTDRGIAFTQPGMDAGS
jgi:hypothetical protein